MKHRAVKGPCICGCGARGVKHHVVAVQKLRELAGRDPDRELLLGLDARNLVRVAVLVLCLLCLAALLALIVLIFVGRSM
jgi:hypothetical protein